jgi:hypothetical protein
MLLEQRIAYYNKQTGRDDCRPGPQARRARHKRKGGRAHSHDGNRCPICQPLPQVKVQMQNQETGDPRNWVQNLLLSQRPR